jgi:hypothetical protein
MNYLVCATRSSAAESVLHTNCKLQHAPLWTNLVVGQTHIQSSAGPIEFVVPVNSWSSGTAAFHAPPNWFDKFCCRCRCCHLQHRGYIYTNSTWTSTSTRKSKQILALKQVQATWYKLHRIFHLYRTPASSDTIPPSTRQTIGYNNIASISSFY